MSKTNILIAGRETPLSESVRQILMGQPDLQVTQRSDESAYADPLQGLTSLPDILVVVLGTRWDDTLRSLASRPTSQRPPMIVIGPGTDSQVRAHQGPTPRAAAGTPCAPDAHRGCRPGGRAPRTR